MWRPEPLHPLDFGEMKGKPARESRKQSVKEEKTSRVVSWKPSTKKCFKAGMVAHTCNPSYSGDRDQEDCASRTAGQS
jgi:hypothetical protein